MDFSDYIVYVDETGDHSLASVNAEYPIFGLAFCIFEKEAYRTVAVPAVQKLKFDYWGHDGIILHSHEIRRQRNDFRILVDREIRQRFLVSVSDLISAAPFTVIATIIDKIAHRNRYAAPADPYEISLLFCIERLQFFLGEREQKNKKTFIVVERRGDSEDKNLELAFRRIIQASGANNLDLRFMDKRNNSAGLQVADLVAYPIARHVLYPTKENRAFAVVEQKIRRGPRGQTSGYGLKVFP